MVSTMFATLTSRIGGAAWRHFGPANRRRWARGGLGVEGLPGEPGQHVGCRPMMVRGPRGNRSRGRRQLLPAGGGAECTLHALNRDRLDRHLRTLLATDHRDA